MKSNQVRRCNINLFIQLYLPFQYFRIKTYVRTYVFRFKDIESKPGIRSKLRCSFYTGEPFYCRFFFFFLLTEKRKIVGKAEKKK